MMNVQVIMEDVNKHAKTLKAPTTVPAQLDTLSIQTRSPVMTLMNVLLVILVLDNVSTPSDHFSVYVVVIKYMRILLTDAFLQIIVPVVHANISVSVAALLTNAIVSQDTPYRAALTVMILMSAS